MSTDFELNATCQFHPLKYTGKPGQIKSQTAVQTIDIHVYITIMSYKYV